MASFTDLPELVGFFSYSRRDDLHSMGSLSRLRARIQSELRLQMGRDFRLWQDTAAIPEGALWEDEINRAIAESAFFIPIVTPSAVGSTHCSFEFQAFLKREAALGRSDLIFPILYITVEALEQEKEWRQSELLKVIGSRQYLDWRKYRHHDQTSTEVAQQIEQFCKNIYRALRQPWVSLEERRHAEEAETKRRQEEQQRQKKELAEALKRAREQERREKAEAGARARAEEEQRQQEEERVRQAAETRARAEQERRQQDEEHRRQEAEARARAEAERRNQEADARRRTEQEKAFASAKRADTLGLVDKFLNDYPDSHLAVDAQALRARLFAREQAHREAIASNDPAVLRAYLEAYPKSPFTAEVRGRLRTMQPRQAWLPSWRMSSVVLAIAGMLVIVAGGIWYMTTRRPVALSAAAVGPLSAELERTIKPNTSFKECATCPEMMVVPAGSFTMGSPDNEPARNTDETRVHVAIARPFAVGRYAVTFDEWDACVADGGCGSYAPSDEGWGRGRRPAINVSWADAKAYLTWLSNKTGKTYRLLSEAEREYVTRAGTATPFWWGSSITPAQANYNFSYVYQTGGWKAVPSAQTEPVDLFVPNPWGLYQVHGNVWEWTEDCWSDTNNGNPGDGTARAQKADCNNRVVRGGSWFNSPAFLRSASRQKYPSDNRNNGFGFRVARTLNR